MRFLFLHPNFPAQYLHIVTALSRSPENQVVFLTRNQETHIDGVQKLNYQPSRQVRPETHHYIRNLESAVLEGQAVYRGLEELQRKGFVPDIALPSMSKMLCPRPRCSVILSGFTRLEALMPTLTQTNP
jgi:hypothetical protein